MAPHGPVFADVVNGLDRAVRCTPVELLRQVVARQCRLTFPSSCRVRTGLQSLRWCH